MHFGQRAFQAPSSKNLKSSCGDGRNNTSDVLSLPFARWQRAAARCGGSAEEKRLARGEGHLGFHLPLEPDARAIGLRSSPSSTALPFARRLALPHFSLRVVPARLSPVRRALQAPFPARSARHQVSGGRFQFRFFLAARTRCRLDSRSFPAPGKRGWETAECGRCLPRAGRENAPRGAPSFRDTRRGDYP